MHSKKLFRLTLENQDTFTLYAKNIHEALEQWIKVLKVNPEVIRKVEEI